MTYVPKYAQAFTQADFLKKIGINAIPATLQISHDNGDFSKGGPKIILTNGEQTIHISTERRADRTETELRAEIHDAAVTLGATPGIRPQTRNAMDFPINGREHKATRTPSLQSA